MGGDDHTTLVTDAAARRRARELWAHLEVVHTVVYFAPEVLEAQRDLGLTWPGSGYVATRLAPLGPVGPELGHAVLFGFSPALVHGVLPAAWDRARPEEVLAATSAAIDRTLAPLLAGRDAEVGRAAELARQAAQFHPVDGRPLAAAHRAVPWPEAPHLVLYEAATRIRESRGDGHVATLVAEGLDGCECHLTVGGDGDKVRRALRARRGWTEPEWDAAVRRLQERGVLAGDGSLSDEGRRLRARIEDRTDALAAPPWAALGTATSDQLLTALRALVVPIVASGILPGIVTRRVAG